MDANNTLWTSPPRAKQDQAEIERKEREADKTLADAIAHYDSRRIADELKKYDSNLTDLKAFAILLS